MSENRDHESEAGTGRLALRLAVASDVPRIRELVDAAYGHYVERLGHRPRPMLDDYDALVGAGLVTVAERESTIVGLIVLEIDEEGFEVDNVAVDPGHRKTGIARALLEHAEAEARRAGFSSVHLMTHELMTENLSLYQRIGFVEFDRRPWKGASRVHMRKQLRPPTQNP